MKSNINGKMFYQIKCKNNNNKKYNFIFNLLY